MHIIIDGYNLIRQSPSLKRFERISLEQGRMELIHRLAEYKRLRGHKITVVFDGWLDGAVQEERQREKGIRIVYSRRGRTADDVIKEMASHSAEEILVVTSDRAVASAVGRRGTVAVSSPEFEARIQCEMEAAFFMTDTELTGPEPDDEPVSPAGTQKKGPSRRMSKRKRLAQRKLKKL